MIVEEGRHVVCGLLLRKRLLAWSDRDLQCPLRKHVISLGEVLAKPNKPGGSVIIIIIIMIRTVRGERANLKGLVNGCIEAKFCNKICVGKLSPRSTQCTPLHRFGIESQKPGKPWGEKNLVHITPGKHGQEKLISSRSSLLSTTPARKIKNAYEYETKYCPVISS